MVLGLFIRAFQVHRSFKSPKSVYYAVISKAIELKAKGNASATFIKKFIELLISTAGYKQRKQPLEINIKSSSP